MGQKVSCDDRYKNPYTIVAIMIKMQAIIRMIEMTVGMIIIILNPISKDVSARASR